MRIGSRLAMILLTVVALAQLTRLILRVEIVAGGRTIPLWVSVIGCLLPGAIALQLWRERHNGSGGH